MIRTLIFVAPALAALAAAVTGVASAAAVEDPGATVTRFQEAYRRGAIEEMLAIYAPDAVFEDVSQRHRVEGTQQLRAMLENIKGLHLRLGLEEKRRLTLGDVVVVEYDYVGELNGAAMSKAAGKEGCPDLEYRLPATSWFEVRGGRITQQKDFIDFATFLELRERLLAVSAPAAASPDGS